MKTLSVDKKNIKAFTIIELLVVVALIGIISTLGIVAYNGYTSSAQQTAAKNSLNAISIAQLEYKSTRGTFYQSSNPNSPNNASTNDINLNLFGVTSFNVSGAANNDKLTGQAYWFSSAATPTTFILTAQEKDGLCRITLNQDSALNMSQC